MLPKSKMQTYHITITFFLARILKLRKQSNFSRAWVQIGSRRGCSSSSKGRNIDTFNIRVYLLTFLLLNFIYFCYCSHKITIHIYKVKLLSVVQLIFILSKCHLAEVRVKAQWVEHVLQTANQSSILGIPSSSLRLQGVISEFRDRGNSYHYWV